MTSDPKLIEAVAKAVAESVSLSWPSDAGGDIVRPAQQAQLLAMARAALAAISASGEWWIAPTKPTGAMIAGGNAAGFKANWRSVTNDVYAGMRDAHLEDTGTDK